MDGQPASSGLQTGGIGGDSTPPYCKVKGLCSNAAGGLGLGLTLTAFGLNAFPNRPPSSLFFSLDPVLSALSPLGPFITFGRVHH